MPKFGWEARSKAGASQKGTMEATNSSLVEAQLKRYGFTGISVKEQGKGKYLWNHPMMHARGLGDDGPALLGDNDLERFSKIQLQTGMTFILKPQVRPAEGKGRASLGDTVTVTESGARRLGKRELQLIVKDCTSPPKLTDYQKTFMRIHPKVVTP